MKQKLLAIVCMLFLQGLYCQEAEDKAVKDFKQGNYTWHSVETLPEVNTYHYVLREDYGIQWRCTGYDSLAYYQEYDERLTQLLQKKYGTDFLEQANAKADSLEQTENWITKPVFLGGAGDFNKYFMDHFTLETTANFEGLMTSFSVVFTVTEQGTLEDIEVKAREGIIIDPVIELLQEMPKWKPAYEYGKPISYRFGTRICISLR